MRTFIKSKAPDTAFLVTFFILLVFGIIMLTSASSDLAKEKYGDSFFYVMHQILYGLVPGIVGFLVGYFVPYRFWQKWAIPLLVFSLLLLLLVFTPLGITVKGGSRWLGIGAFSFQPAEFLKLGFFIYLSAWVSKNQARGKSFVSGFVPFLALVGSIMFLLLLQPATTTAVIIFAASVLTYFTAGARIRFLVSAFLLVTVLISTIIYFSPYRMNRVLSFLHPENDPTGTSYQINQAHIAIGSGGWTGVGFGKSTAKLSYLPEPIGDSIFAVFAEEFGFVGIMIFLGAFFFLLWRGLIIARHAPDNFTRLTITGFMCLIGVQGFVNIAAISGIIPLTGVPLPLVSYGGTALAMFLTMGGMTAQISKYSSSL